MSDTEVELELQAYIATTRVNATPMPLGDYITLCGVEPKEEDDPTLEGYLVENTEGSLTWSPVDTFEASFQELREGLSFSHVLDLYKQGHVCRRRSVRTELNDKTINRLTKNDLLATDWYLVK